MVNSCLTSLESWCNSKSTIFETFSPDLPDLTISLFSITTKIVRFVRSTLVDLSHLWYFSNVLSRQILEFDLSHTKNTLILTTFNLICHQKIYMHVLHREQTMLFFIAFCVPSAHLKTLIFLLLQTKWTLLKEYINQTQKDWSQTSV